MKYSMLNKTERKVVGVGTILSLLTLVFGLSYYGFKNWMYLGFLGIIVMVYCMFTESEIGDFYESTQSKSEAKGK